MIPRCRALLFDLDGTLVDSERDIAEALNTTLIAEGRAALPLAEVLPMIGDGARVLVTRALSAAGEAPSPSLVDRVAGMFQARYVAHPCVFTSLMPGAAELLALGSTLGIACAVVTNKPRVVTERVPQELGIAARFGALWAGGDGPMKPAPDGLLITAERLGVRPEEAWMIGDGPQDVLAGHAAGAFTIAVPGIADRARLLAAEPHLVLEGLHALATLVREGATSA